MTKINPTVKALSILLAAVITAFSFSVKWNLIILGVCLVLMLLSRSDLKKLAIVLIPVTIAALSLFFGVYTSGDTGTTLYTAVSSLSNSGAENITALTKALAVGLRIYVFAFLGMLFALTTDPNEFIYSLQQNAHIGPKYAYGVLAAVNLVPMIDREVKQIRLAHRVRGNVVTPLSFKPLFSALVNSVHWSESLAMAMESKGFDEDGKRTYYITMKIRPLDILFMAAIVGLSIAGALGL